MIPSVDPKVRERQLFARNVSCSSTARFFVSVLRELADLNLSANPKAGGAMEVDCRHTAIWEKGGGKWLIVHEHVSAPLPG